MVDDFFDSNDETAPAGANIEDHKSMEESKSKKKSIDGGLVIEKRDGSTKSNKAVKRIGVHCLAGLGRAPFFVALAFVNNGCSPQNAIDLIRKHRPGAFNLAQAYFILEFKGKQKGKKNNNATCACSIF